MPDGHPLPLRSRQARIAKIRWRKTEFIFIFFSRFPRSCTLTNWPFRLPIPTQTTQNVKKIKKDHNNLIYDKNIQAKVIIKNISIITTIWTGCRTIKENFRSTRFSIPYTALISYLTRIDSWIPILRRAKICGKAKPMRTAYSLSM